MGIKFGQGLGWIKTLTGKDGNSYGTVSRVWAAANYYPANTEQLRSTIQYSSRRTGVHTVVMAN